MKRFLFGTWLLISAGICDAENQTSNYLWPIKGAEAGENIICAPQGYIGDEFNFDYLFIGAEEGTTVLAPTGGVITDFGVGYHTTLYQSIGYKSDKPNFDEKIKEVKPYLDRSLDPRYLCGDITISVGNGIKIYIEGLNGYKTFKKL